MKHEKLKNCPDDKFQRMTGIKRGTFEKMCEVLQLAFAEKRKRRGRRPKLGLEEMLLAALEYRQEGHTYAHIATSCGINESNMYRTIKWVEEALEKDGRFSLPERKATQEGDAKKSAERPQKGGRDAVRRKKSAAR